MSGTKTKFDYLLNAFELASQADKPAEHGYAERRRALFAYVRELEEGQAASRLKALQEAAKLAESMVRRWALMNEGLPCEIPAAIRTLAGTTKDGESNG